MDQITSPFDISPHGINNAKKFKHKSPRLAITVNPLIDAQMQPGLSHNTRLTKNILRFPVNSDHEESTNSFIF